MAADTTKRFDRIVSIFVQLQSKRVVRAKELSERFGVSLRTIYRDIKSLEQAGVPVFGEAGTGYSIVEGFRLPPIQFTKEEVMGFVGAEKLMEKFVDKTLAGHFKTGIYKIKAVLRMSEKDWASTVENQIVMRQHQNTPFNDQVPDALSVLFESIAQSKKVLLNYKGVQDDRPSERPIEPVGMFHLHNYWYLMAFCDLRQDYRQFRLDRIERLQLLPHLFERTHPPLDTFLEEKKKSPTTEVRIAVRKTVARYMQWERKYYGFIEENDCGDEVEMIFQSPDIEEEFPRWISMFADSAQIISPDVLRTRVKALLEAGLANMQRPARPATHIGD